MFGKLKGASAKESLAKDINESIKTLSYLARAEKYFDLELEKNGQITKPLLRIVDVIEPLRQIHESVVKLEKGQKVTSFAKASFNKCNEIVDVANDILALNPKGLVTSDKVALVKLPEKLAAASTLAGLNEAPAYQEVPATKTKAPRAPKAAPAKAKATTFPEFPEYNIEAQPEEPIVTQQPVQFGKQPAQPELHKPTPAEEVRARMAEINAEINLDQPLEWENTAAENFAAQAEVAEEISQPAFAQAPAQPQFEQAPQINPIPSSLPNSTKQRDTKAAQAARSENARSENVYEFTPAAAAQSFGLPQKYLATSYAGMNLQEAAQIISELAENPDNLEIIMLEHSSRVKPVAEGRDIVADLYAFAPIADSFEIGTEIIDKKHLTVLKNADRIISVCRDISGITADGFDKRKQKLFEKFVPQDIRRTVEMAKTAYPEIFSGNEAAGGVAGRLLDFSDILIEHAKQLDDQLFSNLVAQVVTEIAQYAEYNELGFKFDITSKKNKVVGKAESLASRTELSALRAITFVPQIARHAHELLALDAIPENESDIISRGLDLLQQVYIHARDNYSSQLQDLYSNKAA